MVSIFAFDPTWAIFFRRNEMYASTLLSLALDEGPQARLISCSFESTAPGEPSRMRAMANSFCDRRMDSSPQVRSMDSRFSVRSPTVSVSKTTSPWRRVRARKWASSSAGEKGLVM